LVDDYPDTVEYLAETCELLGFEVRVACDGTSALTAGAEFLPHVAVLDIGLPDLDGFDVARQMRASQALRDTWLVALSGFHDARTKTLAAEVGFDEYLVKPIDQASFEAVLVSLASSQSPQAG
jgi:DNA-binding response OmpR family regulator